MDRAKVGKMATTLAAAMRSGPKISRRDVIRNAAAVVGAMVFGDMTCQLIEGHGSLAWDIWRTSHMAVIGAFIGEDTSNNAVGTR